MIIRVSFDTTPISRPIRMLYADQLPFATSVALNDVAKLAQTAQRRRIHDVFTIRRRDFADRAVKIQPFATKRRLEVTLKIEPPGGAQRADIFSKFEEGGRKTSRLPGGRVAIPEDVRRGKTGVVGRSQRPRALGLQLHGRGPKATVFTGKNRTFMIKPHAGGGGIFKRTGRASTVVQGRERYTGRFSGRMSGGYARGNVKMLYSFARHAKIDDRLGFEETIHGTVQRMWPTTFGRAWEQAVRTAK